MKKCTCKCHDSTLTLEKDGYTRQGAHVIVGTIRPLDPEWGRYVVDSEVISEPGSKIEISKIILSEEAKRGLSINSEDE